MGSIGHAGNLLDDGTAVAETGIDNVPIPQLVEGLGILAQSLRLAQGLSLPMQAEPAKVLLDQGIIAGPAPRVVNVLESQETRAVVAACQFVGHEGRVGMAQMKPPGGTGCKARQHVRSLGF